MSHGGGGGHFGGGGHHGGVGGHQHHHVPAGQPGFVPTGSGGRRPTAGRWVSAILFGVLIVAVILILGH